MSPGVESLSLPPVFHPVRVPGWADAFERAVHGARRGAEDGTLYWAERSDRLDLGLALTPETPLGEARLGFYAAMLGVGDALGALVPPTVAVTFDWPGAIEVNGAIAATVRAASAPVKTLKARPRWLVLGVGVEIGGGPDDAPGRDRQRTSLYEEGCGEVTAQALLEAFARHFLVWLDAWQSAGFRHLVEAYLRHLLAYVEQRPTVVGRRGAPATILGIDDSGGLRIKVGRVRRTLSLARALRREPAKV